MSPKAADPQPPALRYSRDPDRIHREAIRAIRAETDLSGLPAPMAEVALRLSAVSGLTDLAADLRWGGDPGPALRAALSAGAPVLCDTDMVAHGLIRSRLGLSGAPLSFLNSTEAAALGRAQNVARPSAAVDLWLPHLAGAVAVIGEYAAALFRLLELMDQGAPRPAVILALPVGFYEAAEAKAELCRDPRGVPYVTLLGRRGGAAMAVAALNALALAPA